MNKIMNQFQLALIYTAVFLFTGAGATAQIGQPNKYGLVVISNTSDLINSIGNDSSKIMVDLGKRIPGLVVDLRYAGTNNFMKEKLYPDEARAWLRRVAADSLVAVRNELKQYGLGLKIFDAYRPWSITEKMWEKVKDDRYAADPKKGSNHNRGIAVDLTIVDTDTGQEVDMGTGFDNFSDTAHHSFTGLFGTVRLARYVLKTVMEKHGFKALETEWWHYSLSNVAGFELLDIGFDELNRLMLSAS